MSQSVAKDSFFKVLRANRNVFEHNLDQFEQDLVEEEEDEVKLAFPLLTYCNVLTCTSRANKVANMYPLVKERVSPESKSVKRIYLITSDKHRKEIKITGDQSKRLNSFFLNSREFGDDIDSFITVTESNLRVYDSNMDLMKTFSGLNIRDCINIH